MKKRRTDGHPPHGGHQEKQMWVPKAKVHEYTSESSKKEQTEEVKHMPDQYENDYQNQSYKGQGRGKRGNYENPSRGRGERGRGRGARGGRGGY